MRDEKTMDVFIMSPHDDVKNFVQNAIGIYLQRTSRGKSPPVPIFKNERQRGAFHLVVTNLAKSPILSQTQGTPAAFQYLERSSGASARCRFDTKVPVKVYVQGHGAPGNIEVESGKFGHSYIWDGASSANRRKSASAGETAKLLIAMGLPEGSYVRVNSCWSGTASNISPDAARSTLEKSGHLLGLMGVADQTFAGNLHAALASRKPRTRGYPAPTMRHPCDSGYMVVSDRSGYRLATVGKSIFVTFNEDADGGMKELNIKRGKVGRDYG